MKSELKLASVVSGVFFALALVNPAAAQYQTDFESFTLGSIDGQQGWSVSNPNFDQEIVDNNGNVVWRLSNEITTESFGDHPFSPGSGLIAGESTAEHPSGNGPVTDTFVGSFDFQSATGAAQPGLAVTVSPDTGLGGRQSFIRIQDNGTDGLNLVFFETANNDPNVNPNGGFRSSTIATGLAYDQVYRLGFEITFVDGIVDNGDGSFSGNDIVEIYLDEQLIHTGTTFESFYWTSTLNLTPPTIVAVDSLLFRISGTAEPANAGNGIFIDNVFMSNETDRLILPEARTVPTLGNRGLVLMAMLLALVAFFAVRKRAHG